ncbi:MAG TPA: type II toxin-antitoxin system RelE/ParE family toxin [Terracidiphilus sp.]|nr:type II toxin-antitoxin system RelE/ParE family toxin [Terracidiphilus sp.]
MRVRVARKAQSELDDIFVYLAEHAGLDVADRVVEAIEEQFALLGESPGIGRRRDDLAPGVLSFPVGKYIIYYRKARGAVHILHVFHGARDQERAFRKG